MRTTKELLELMLTRQDLFWFGLCQWAGFMYNRGYFDLEELARIDDLIKSNPTLRRRVLGAVYYWPEGELQPRINWINKRIKELE
jgi:hypothetical protein